MDLEQGMAQTVAQEAPSGAQIAACRWLTEEALRVYSDEYSRSGFQGGLQWYRCATSPLFQPELESYSGRRIEVPCCFISGKRDWGIYQSPGALESMASTACAKFKGIHLLDGAGHWVQQEQSEAVIAVIKQFLTSPA